MRSFPPPQTSPSLVRLVDRAIAGTKAANALTGLVTLLLVASSPGASAQEPARPEGLSVADFASLRAAYDEARHAVVSESGGYLMRNHAQDLTARFDHRGFAVAPDAGSWSFGLELVRYGWDGDLLEVTQPRRVAADGGRVAYEWDDRLAEWYVNDRRGLEHGYTVFARAPDADGPLSIEVAIRGDLVPAVSENGRDVRFEDPCGGAVLTYSGLTVLDADGVAIEARWQALPGGMRLSVRDENASYPLTIDPIVQQAYLKASNTGADDRFGESICVSGDSVIVGAFWEDSNSIGQPLNNGYPNSGAAYVFVRNGTAWSHQAYLKGSWTDPDDNFGKSVAISGNHAVVGAWYEDSNMDGINGLPLDNDTPEAGAAYVFVRNGTTWSQQAYVKASNSYFGEQFGVSVAIDGATMVVGAYLQTSNATGVNGNETDHSAPGSGAAYVFVRSGTTWSQQAFLKASNTGSNDRFGYSVAIDGNTIVAGAHMEDSAATGVDGDQVSNAASSSGAAYVFTRSGTTWSQQAYLKASNTEANDQFGHWVSVSGDTIVVGANQEDSAATGVDGDQGSNAASNSGAAYVFARSGTVWSQQAYLKSPNSGIGDQFGWKVAAAGNRVAVGAPNEDSNAIGVNGDPNDNSRTDSGAVVVFERSGSTWSQSAYIKSTNSDAFDFFGHSISASDDTLLVGAPGEDSHATGVNGSQISNGMSVSGASYVFGLDAPLFSTFCHPGINGVIVCPCGQPANPSGGCANYGATATSGAVLGAGGVASLGADTVVLAATNHRTAPSAGILNIFFTASGVVGVGVPSNAGVRCASTNLKRLYSGNTTAGTLSKPGMGDPSVSARSMALGVGITAGETRHYFNVYRDSGATGPCGSTAINTNLTNGGSITWGP